MWVRIHGVLQNFVLPPVVVIPLFPHGFLYHLCHAGVSRMLANVLMVFFDDMAEAGSLCADSF